MPEEQFTDALNTIVAEAMDDGLSLNLIISELELKIMALNEQQNMEEDDA